MDIPLHLKNLDDDADSAMRRQSENSEKKMKFGVIRYLFRFSRMRIDASGLVVHDLPPINRTVHSSKNPENDGQETKQIQRRADHRISQAG